MDEAVLRQVLVAGVAAPEHQLRLLAGGAGGKRYRVALPTPRVVAVLGHHRPALVGYHIDAALVVADEMTYHLPIDLLSTFSI